MSFLASIRRLLGDGPAGQEQQQDAASEVEPEAKRQRQHGFPASSRAARPLPPDYTQRLHRLVERGWPAARAVEAMEKEGYVAGNALTYLQAHYPHERKDIDSATPRTTSKRSRGHDGSCSSAASMIDEVTCIFERLPLAPIRNNNMRRPHSSTLDPASPTQSSPSLSSSASSSLSASSSIPSSASAAAAAVSSSSNVEVDPSSPSPWNCSMCTFSNHPALNACEMCDTPRPSTSTSDVHGVAHSMDVEHSNVCGICFDSIPSHDSSLSNPSPPPPPPCHHRFCHSCLSTWIKDRVESGQVSSMKCCADGCNRELSEQELTHLMDNVTAMRYRRYKRMQQLSTDPRVLFCPNAGCEVALFCMDGQNRPALKCPDCDGKWCFNCKTAWHPGQSCAEYKRSLYMEGEKKALEGLVENERAFLEKMESMEARQCAQCGSWVEKSEGCDKMTCRCGFQFCQKCGSVGARCSCTGRNHIFFDQATVLRNWQPAWRSHAAASFGAPHGYGYGYGMSMMPYGSNMRMNTPYALRR